MSEHTPATATTPAAVPEPVAGTGPRVAATGGWDEEVRAAAQVWLRCDPDPSTRTELADVLSRVEAGDQAAAADLASRFSGPLAFGTAGLRGAVGAGESRMNVAVVTRASFGLGRHLLDVVPEARPPRVVVGCDARYGSHEFMAATVETLSALGIEVLALPERLPTPVTAYTVRALDCDGGVMVTASHNPPADNGYKVYLGGRATEEDGRGVQIVPPADAAIAAAIAAAPPACDIARDRLHVTELGRDAVEPYLARTGGLARPASDVADLRIVLTPMHGVGGETAVEVLRRAGFTDVHLVPQQAEPDPDFPTVRFPNPEEPGALDLALGLARAVDADVVLALDPDADRCSMAAPMPDGSWRQLSGDEIGALLGEQAAADASRDGDTLAASIVSSRLLARIAEAHGLRHAGTLTGFKWIARTPGIRFGYEEAIGYCTDPQAVHDKDGISAAVRLAGLVSELRAHGRGVQDALDDLARAHGLHATTQLSFRVDDLSVIADAMTRLRANPVERLAGSPVVERVDLAAGWGDLAPTDGIWLRTVDDDRVVVRPSGTEPKLKCYLEVVLPCQDDVVPRDAAAARLDVVRADITAALGL